MTLDVDMYLWSYRISVILLMAFSFIFYIKSKEKLDLAVLIGMVIIFAGNLIDFIIYAYLIENLEYYKTISSLSKVAISIGYTICVICIGIKTADK